MHVTRAASRQPQSDGAFEELNPATGMSSSRHCRAGRAIGAAQPIGQPSPGDSEHMNNTWKWTRTCFSAGLLGSLTLAAPAWADNPIVQTNYTADPAPMVHEGKLYIYTSHDEDVTVNNFYTMNDWRLYSTEDMVNWTDHGSPAGLNTFNWSTDSAWAPQGIFRNGSFYLYVPINNNTGARIGVGVSQNVAGPFMDPLGKELVQTAASDIDPTVFIDDDEQAYMYWGNATLQYVKLNADMTSYSGTPTTVTLAGFTEGPWLHKRESLYYMVYAGMGGQTEKISYATSNSPTGPWSVRGDIMAAGTTYTNHAGVIDYKGHSYFFYHNSALPGGNDFKRSVCVEEFTYGEDGSIPQLTMSQDGPAAVAKLNPFLQVEAETIAFSSGLKTEVSDDTGAGMNVTSISPGDYIKVKEVDFLDGVTSFEARVSSAKSNATIELHLDSQQGTLLGTCDVSGASAWTTVTCPVSGGSGTHDLFLTFTGDGDNLFEFNWWKFTGPTTTAPDGGAGGGDDSDTAPGDSGTESADITSAQPDGTGVGSSDGNPTTGTGTSVTTGVTSSGAPTTSPTGGPGTVTTSSDVVPTTSGSSAGTGTTSQVTATNGTAETGNVGAPNSDGTTCGCRVGTRHGPGTAFAAAWVVACGLVLRRRRCRAGIGVES